jgi:hypothetical protein
VTSITCSLKFWPAFKQPYELQISNFKLSHAFVTILKDWSSSRRMDHHLVIQIDNDPRFKNLLCWDIQVFSSLIKTKQLFFSHKVETPIHDNIRELVTWECKEYGVKSWMC